MIPDFYEVCEKVHEVLYESFIEILYEPINDYIKCQMIKNISNKFRDYMIEYNLEKFIVLCDNINNSYINKDRTVHCDLYVQLEDTLTVGFRGSLGIDGFSFAIIPPNKLRENIKEKDWETR